MKKITIGTKRSTPPAHVTPDDWVSDRQANQEPMKRLTIVIPLSLQQKVKNQSALKGEQMADVVRELLERHFDSEYLERMAFGFEAGIIAPDCSMRHRPRSHPGYCCGGIFEDF